MNRPGAKKILLNPIHCLATGLGSGLSPVAPGTTGSIAAVIVYMALIAHLPIGVQIIVVLISSVIGVYLCGKTAKDWGAHDHGSIVWDEWAGVWITLLGLPWDSWGILLGFVYFRLFDIWKPWPISWCDQNLQGGWGIMVDDLLAGVIALVATYSTLYGIGQLI